MTPPARVFIVAATPTMRAGLRAMLEADTESRVRVVGESSSSASSAEDADVFLIADEGAALESTLLEEDVALVVLTDDERAASKLRELSPRGWAILPPDAPPGELGAAVLAAARGLTVLSRQLAERLLQAPATVDEPPEPLTAREREVLELLARGLSNRLIARELHISEHTVKFHISSLYAKLDVGNRAEAVSQGARLGLLSL